MTVPAYPCKWPMCTAYVRQRGYCPAHAGQGKRQPTRHAFYDQHHRNTAAKAFYASADWQRAREKQLTALPVCQRCGIVFANTVHHVKPLSQCTPAERLAPSNLKSLCAPCHNAEEAEAIKGKTHVF